MKTKYTTAYWNDDFRRGNILLCGQQLMTAGIAALPDVQQSKIMHAVRLFDDFNEDNDPYGEHDFGCIELEGMPRVFWKIDIFDRENRDMAAKDPSNPYDTFRVLTVMLATEY